MLHLKKFQVPEFAVAGLGQAGIEGVEHAGEFESLERGPQAGVVNGHDKVRFVDVVAAECVRMVAVRRCVRCRRPGGRAALLAALGRAVVDRRRVRCRRPGCP